MAKNGKISNIGMASGHIFLVLWYSEGGKMALLTGCGMNTSLFSRVADPSRPQHHDLGTSNNIAALGPYSRTSYDKSYASDLSRWPSRPIRSVRFIVTCTRIWTLTAVKEITSQDKPVDTHIYQVLILCWDKVERRWPNLKSTLGL